MSANISTLFADLLAEKRQRDTSLPPVANWNPPLCGDMDLTICRNGSWVHEGTEIKREALIKLFASVLKREGDEYFLVTPVEKWRITVEDAPFYISSVERQQRQKSQALVFQTTTGERIVAGVENPVWIDTDPVTGKPAPYLLVRANLKGLLSRPVFYQLAEWCQQRPVGYGVESLGQFFLLEVLES